MPSVDEVKLHTDLVSDSLRSNCCVEDRTEIFLRVKKPCWRATIQIQDRFRIIEQNNVHIKPASYPVNRMISDFPNCHINGDSQPAGLEKVIFSLWHDSPVIDIFRLRVRGKAKSATLIYFWEFSYYIIVKAIKCDRKSTDTFNIQFTMYDILRIILPGGWLKRSGSEKASGFKVPSLKVRMAFCCSALWPYSQPISR